MDKRADEPVVEVESQIAAPPDKVWEALTQVHSPMFMGAEMDTDFQQGSDYALRGEWQGRPFTDYGTIETAIPSREFTFTHWSGTPKPPESYNAVQVKIDKKGAGSAVTLSQFQRGKPVEVDDKAKAEFKNNWAMMLEGLKKAAEAA